MSISLRKSYGAAGGRLRTRSLNSCDLWGQRTNDVQEPGHLLCDTHGTRLGIYLMQPEVGS